MFHSDFSDWKWGEDGIFSRDDLVEAKRIINKISPFLRPCYVMGKRQTIRHRIKQHRFLAA